MRYDWADVVDTEQWSFLNNKRYDIMKEALQGGNPVRMISGGTSLQPLVWSGDTCIINPIIPGVNSKIQAGDIVFCQVQPCDRYYIHLVWEASPWEDENGVMQMRYIIGNSKPAKKAR